MEYLENAFDFTPNDAKDYCAPYYSIIVEPTVPDPLFNDRVYYDDTT